MTPVIFTYGTLLRASRAHRIIQSFSAKVRPARINGTLYHTGYGFPVVDVETEGQVLGELVLLNDQEAAFASLDRYEGVGNASFGLYRRVEVEAYPLEGGEPVLTQVYAVNPGKLASIPGLERVETGDWLAYLKTRGGQ